ncbi:hypothetical protein [Embleya sp. MST-111070]
MGTHVLVPAGLLPRPGAPCGITDAQAEEMVVRTLYDGAGTTTS